MIDFHCHLDLYNDPKLAVEDADASGVYVLSVTTTPKAWRGTSALVVGRRRIRTALGLHPELAHDRIGELALFEHLGTKTRYFGEIGLDGSPQLREFQSAQEKVFNTILGFADSLGGRILSIHSRRAVDAVIEALEKHPNSGPAILHWFTGSQTQLKRAIDLGCWFSCGPAMLRTTKGRALATSIPKTRMLTETDGPFAKTGSRPLQPADSWQAVEMLGDIWQIDHDEVVRILRNNLKTLTEVVPSD